MKKLNICDYTTSEIMSFALNTYPTYFVSPDKRREGVYYRRVVAYLASESGSKVTEIARLMNVTHPNIIWAVSKAHAHITENNELFMKCYADFVKRFNATKTDAHTDTVNGGEQVNA